MIFNTRKYKKLFYIPTSMTFMRSKGYVLGKSDSKHS